MGANQYEDALETLDEQGTQNPNPYLETLDALDGARARALRTSVVQSQGQAPDRAAEVRKLADKTGLAAAVVDRNFEDLSKRVKVDETPYAAMLKETPALAEWASDAGNHAIAQDDLEKLGLLEWIVTAPQRAFAQSVHQMRAASLRTQQLYRELTVEERDRLQAEKYHAEAGGELGAGGAWFRGAVTGGSQLLANIVFGAAKAGPKALLGASVGGVIGGIGGGVTTGGVGAIPGAIAGAKFGAGVGATAGAAQFGFELEAGLALDEFLDPARGFKDEFGQPLDPDVARAAALAAGAYNAGLEVIGLGILARSIPGVKQLTGKIGRSAIREALRNPTVRAALKDAAKTYAGVLTAETGVEVAQRAVTILSGELGKIASGQGIPSREPTDILEDLVQEGMAAAQGFLFVAAPGPTMSLAHNAARAQRATRAASFWQALGEGVTQSETVKRMPEAAQAFLAKATKDGPVETVYAPVDTFAQYWQTKDLDPREVAAELTGDPEAYDRAIRTGADLPIPTAAYAVKLAGTEHHAFFAQELRLGPEEMNTRESQAYAGELERIVAEQAEAEQAATETPAQQVRRQVVAELTGAGMPVETAETYATLYESAFGAFAERAGVDPAELYAAYGLTVERPDLTAPLPGVGAPDVQPTPAEAQEAARTVDESGRDLLTPGGFAGPERRQAAGTGPSGVERRRSDPDAPLDVTKPADAAARMLAENPNIIRQSADLGRARRIPEPPDPTRGAGAAGEAPIVDNIADEAQTTGEPTDATPADTDQGTAAPTGTELPGSAPQPGAAAPRRAFARGRTRARADRGAADRVPDSLREDFARIYTGARELGYRGTRDFLAARFLEKAERAHQIAADLAAEVNDTGWRGLLIAVANAGGIGVDAETGSGSYRGEVAWLLETLGSVGVIKRGRRAGQLMPQHRAGIKGAPGVILGKGQGGYSLDHIAEAVAQEKAWAHLRDINDFLPALEEAVTKGHYENQDMPIPGTASPSPSAILENLLDVRPDLKWWETAPDFDVSEFDQGLFDELLEPPAPEDVLETRIGRQVFRQRPDGDVDRFRINAAGEEVQVGETIPAGDPFLPLEVRAWPPPAAPADVLETGETQPRLPGAEDVRETETATPEFEAPFSLTSEVSTRKGKQTTLFQGAFHGSPHIFEKFSLHAIGTGEGAQAYGWGLYFTSKKEIAEEYRKRLAGQARGPELVLDGMPLFDREIGAYYVAWEKLPAATVDAPVSTWAATSRPQDPTIARGLLELSSRTYWFRLQRANPEDTVRAGLERSIANVDREHAKGFTLTGDKARDLYEREGWVAALKALDLFGDALQFSEGEKPGRTYKVEIPDDEHYLDWDKPASQQSARVQAALRDLGITWETFKVKSIGQMRQWLNGPTAAALAREDIGIRESLGEAHRYVVEEDETALRAWQYQHQGYFRQGGVDPTGERIYGELQHHRWLAQPLSPGGVRTLAWGEGQRLASEALNAAGVVGIRYLDGMSRRAGEGSYNFVVFDDKLVEITEYDQRDLILQHNVTEANVRHAAKLGGLPVPSLAIAKAADALTNFGEITLLGPSAMADPQGYARPQVFGADVYSPRYPTIHLKIDAAAEKALAALWQAARDVSGESYVDLDSLQKDGARYLETSGAPMVAFLREQGVELPAPVPDSGKYARPGQIDQFRTHVALRDTIERAGLEPAFKAYVQALLASLNPKEVIFRGFTNAGNRSYKPHTLENVVAILKKDLRGGESSGNLYGVGQLRAKFTPKFRTLAGIQKAKDRIVSDEAFEAAKKEIETELFRLVAAVTPYYQHDADRFGFVDTVMAVMEDAPRMGIGRALTSYGFNEVPLETQQEIAAFMQALREMPTEYFEAKILREVDLAEFVAAVVPADTPADVVEILERRGLLVETYARGDQADRKRVIADVAKAEQEKILFAPKRRGSIRFGADRQMTIALLERADLSTFLHESGHFFLEVFGDVRDALAAQDPATLTPQQRQILGDYTALLAWLKVDGRAGLGVEQHEQFARGFEAYLMEGNAPSLELRAVFARFRAWLVGIYRAIARLEVNLTPEVRAIFDRMIATDQAIAAAQAAGRVEPMFLTAEQAGMTPADFSLYRAKVTAASQAAREKLERKMLAEVQRETEAAWKERRAAIEGEVAAEVHQEPVYRALAAMQRGTTPAGEPILPGEELPPWRLSRQMIVDRYGADRLKRLPRPYIYTTEGGLDPDSVAQTFDFATGDELLTAVETAEPMRAKIQRETERRMLAEHGSMLLDGSLLEEAQAAISNDDQEIVIRAELRALGALRRQVDPFVKAERQKGREAVQAEQAKTAAAEDQVAALKRKARGGAATIRAAIPPANQLRDFAKAQIAKTRIREIRPAVYWSASRRAAGKAIDAAARQDLDAAIVAKQQELINLALHRAATQALEDAEARVRTARDLGKPAARARLGLAGEAYLDQVDGILDRYEFARVSEKALKRRTSLRKFVAALEAEGLPVDLPEDVLEEHRRVNYRELSYEELVGVTDALASIVHLARLKNRLLKNVAQRELEQAAGTVAESIRDHARRKPRAVAQDRRPSEERRRTIADFFAGHRKLASLLREMDGFQDGGAAWEAIMVPLNDAAAVEAEMNADATRAFAALVARAFPGRSSRGLYTKTLVPAVGKALSRMERIMVAANWGNDGNRQRVRSAYGWTDGQVQAILDTLTGAELEFVQGLFDLVNGYWPQIEAKQQRVYGIAPEKVEATEIRAANGTIRGGYFPLKYDDRLSASAIAHLDLEAANLARAAAYAHATTKRGHTQERAQKVKLPVRLDFGVVFEHVQQVIHDLSHHEALVDVARILGHRDVQAAILETHGDLVYKQIRNTIRDVAFGDVPAVNGFERAINHVRMGATVAGLGWNLAVSLLQPIGLTNSVVRIGPKWVAKGIARWIRNPTTMVETVKWIEEVSPMMRSRGRTMQREINEIRNQVGVESGSFRGWMDEALSKTTFDTVTRQGIADSYFWMIQTAQRFADVPTWLGMYEKAMANGETEARAVKLADQAVLDSQGGGQTKDLAQVQRGGPMYKLWTNFYSYFNVVYNQMAESRRRTSYKNPAEVGRLASDYFWLWIAPATLAFLLREALRPRDDDTPEEFAERLVAENIGYLAGTMLGAREVSGALAGSFGYEGPAGARAFAGMARLGQQARQGELDRAFWRALSDVAGVFFHVPSGQVWKTTTGIAAIAEGKTENPGAVVAGPPRDR